MLKFYFACLYVLNIELSVIREFVFNQSKYEQRCAYVYFSFLSATLLLPVFLSLKIVGRRVREPTELLISK